MKEDTWLYRSGDVFLPASVRAVLERYHIGNDRSLFYITNWSLVHFLSGIVTGYILYNSFPTWSYYTTGFILHGLWELWQIYIGMTKWKTLRGQIDIGVDTAMFMMGMFLFLRLFTGKDGR
jgi:hypothetical protein